MKGKETTISTERLKPAYIELQEKQEPRTYAKGKISSALSSGSSDSEEGSVATATFAQLKTAPPTSAQTFCRKVSFQ
ncbi:hypothetical protein QLX08_011589 [Tetragonisca angustula]|uniref:Uncharacterized protein n=1 Tax=Tetragonisca angustula TaxID=166442 RepID=A0AAW0Z7W7_9HYME